MARRRFHSQRRGAARWARRPLGALLAASVLVLDTTPVARHLLRVPAVVTMAAGQSQSVRLAVPGRIAVRAASPGLLVDGAPATGAWRSLPGQALSLLPARPGLYTLGLRLFGVLPWRALRVRAVAVPAVEPGGQSVGIVLQPVGPLVVRLDPVRGAAGLRPSPAAAAGLRPGDYLLAVDGRPLRTDADITPALRAAGGGPAELTFLRGGQAHTVTVDPVPARGTGSPRLGAWVRDQASGIGTLTFAAAAGGAFGALGHAVSDPTTGQSIVLGAGSLLPSRISGLSPSRDGRPGEKLGSLVAGAQPLGTVTANTDVGVFGHLAAPAAPPAGQLLPVALEDQIHPGAAEVLTVVHGTRVRSFSARIVAVLPQRRASAKGLVLRITDPALLAETGGIVQGMSGSPIIQDGRLVGAVTHVFVDDPTRGYGVLALWMAQAAGLAGTSANPGHV